MGRGFLTSSHDENSDAFLCSSTFNDLHLSRNTIVILNITCDKNT